MSRSPWKFTVFNHLANPSSLLKASNDKSDISDLPTTGINPVDHLVFKDRASFISEKRINYLVSVYNGQRWCDFRVTPERVGHRVGEFAPTRKRPIPKKKKEIKKK